MWLAEVDGNGYVVNSGIRDIDRDSYVLSGPNYRLVADPVPSPTEYNPRFKTPVKVEPVVGDTIAYKFKDNPKEVLSPEEKKIMDTALQKAKEFLDSKSIDSSHVFYFVTVYNASIQQDIAMAFSSGVDVNNVKVSLLTNSVTEWYQVGSFIVDGVEYSAGVSKDLVTGDIIDKYTVTPEGQAKYTPDGKIVMTYPYELKPKDPEHAKLLEEFKYRDHITGWSNKENGFIIQYDRLFKKR